MKNVTLVFVVLLINIGLIAQVGINEDNSDPHSSAMLEVKSTDKGLLPPRMTQTERDAISLPAEGLIVWCNNCGIHGEMQVYNGTEWTNLAGGTAALVPQVVGDYCEGGIVFYIFQSGDPGYIEGETHGLICALSDQNGVGGIQWYNGSFITTGATSTSIGSGQTNTAIIISIQGAGSYAATICDIYAAGGYEDWFLPSKDELAAMYSNKAIIETSATTNGGTGFVHDYYWCSSEFNDDKAWCQMFFDGDQYNYSKFYYLPVRAVRAF